MESASVMDMEEAKSIRNKRKLEEEPEDEQSESVQAKKQRIVGYKLTKKEFNEIERGNLHGRYVIMEGDKVKEILQYQNGCKEGWQELWREEEKVIYLYKNDRPHGPFIECRKRHIVVTDNWIASKKGDNPHSDSKIIALTPYDMSKQTTYHKKEAYGESIVYSSKGRVVGLRPYKEGKLHGIRLYLDEKEEIRKIINFRDGVRHGEIKFYEEGRPIFEGQYSEGKKNGTFRWFYASVTKGVTDFTKPYKILNYEHGVLEGPALEFCEFKYYVNGKLFGHCNGGYYLDGREVGQSVFGYFRDGLKLTLAKTKANIDHGETPAFDGPICDLIIAYYMPC